MARGKVNEGIDVEHAAGTSTAASRGLPPLPPPPRLPGRARLAAWCAGCLALCALVALAVTAAGSAGNGLVMLALPLSQAPGPLIRRWRLRRLLSDRRHRTLADDPTAAALAAALGPYGVHELTVRVGTAVRGMGRSYRAGGRGVVVLDEHVLRLPWATAFFLTHELGHLARHDFVRRPLTITTLLACWVCGVLTVPWAVVGLVPALALVVAFNWTMELDCDRIAARWAGLGPAERAMSLLDLAHRQPGRSPLAALRIRLHLTHPPVGRRLAAVRAAASPAGPSPTA